MTWLENEIVSVLEGRGAEFIRFVDVSGLLQQQNRGFPNAICFSIILTPLYIHKVMAAMDYVNTMIAHNQIDNDEFYLTELKTGELANQLAELLILNGYKAYAQSDENLIATNAFDEKYKKTPLPHKTIAVLAGIGWIGKNNLLVTSEYGPALCIGTVLTDAPLTTIQPLIIDSKCGKCKKCVNICQPKALLGNIWGENISRENIVDVYKCTTCMECLIHCPYTQKYLKNSTSLRKKNRE